MKSRLQAEQTRRVLFEEVGPVNYNPHNRDFQCVHCRRSVSADWLMAGVKNRNHCPYCMWSRHLDLYEAGDRLSACKMAMQPAALTLKKTNKKYGVTAAGELMLVHLCTDCGKVSINRIAADDDLDTVLRIYEQSLEMDAYTRLMIENAGIRPLDHTGRPILMAQLFGQM